MSEQMIRSMTNAWEKTSTGKKIAALSFAAVIVLYVFKRTVNKRRERNERERSIKKLAGGKKVEAMAELPGKQWLFGHFLYLRRQSIAVGNFALHYFLKESIRLGRTFTFQLPFVPGTVFTSDPLVIDRFLNTGFTEGVYEKSPQLKRQYAEFLGKGIFVTNGDEWKRQRKTARPLFDKKRLPTYVELFFRNSVHLLDTFSHIIEVDSGEYHLRGIDVQDYFMRFTLDSFCEIGFGVNINSIDSTQSALTFQSAFDYVQTFTEYRGRTGEFWRIKEFFFPDREFPRHLAHMDDFISNIISQRKLEPLPSLQLKNDLLSQLLISSLSDSPSDSSPSSLGKEEEKDMRDWVMNFLIAGRDTTAVLLTWCTYLLAKEEHANVVDRIIEEMADLLGITPADVNPRSLPLSLLAERMDYSMLKKQKYLHRVLQETLRLYPPVPVDGYAALRDDVITTSTGQSHFIPRGTLCVYSAWVTHHHPDNYADPELFNPDRFNDHVIPSAFVPFHFGPRICLGQEMAYLEAKIMMACLISQYRFSLVDPSQVVPKQAIILTSLNGVRIHLSPR